MGAARIHNPEEHPLSLWGTNEAYSWFYQLLLYRYNVKDKNVVYHIPWCCCLAMSHSNHSLQFHCCTWYTAQLLPILMFWEGVMANDRNSGLLSLAFPTGCSLPVTGGITCKRGTRVVVTCTWWYAHKELLWFLHTLKKDKSLKHKIHNGSKLITFFTMPY